MSEKIRSLENDLRLEQSVNVEISKDNKALSKLINEQQQKLRDKDNGIKHAYTLLNEKEDEWRKAKQIAHGLRVRNEELQKLVNHYQDAEIAALGQVTKLKLELDNVSKSLRAEIVQNEALVKELIKYRGKRDPRTGRYIKKQ